MGTHRPARIWSINYKTLVAAIGVLIALAVLVVVLDDGRQRRDSAAALSRRDTALQAALEQSQENSKQLDRLLDLVATEKAQVDALRRQLTKLGVKPVEIKTPANPTTGTGNTGGASSRPTNGSGGSSQAGGSHSSPTPIKPSPTSPAPPSPSPTTSDHTICVLVICVG